MDINDVYNLTKYRANKSGYLGSISPNDFNLLFPRSEIRYFNKEYTQYASTQRISDALSKFKSDPTIITIDNTGRYNLPNDLFHVDAITKIFDGAQVEVTRVEADRIANNLSSSYDAPDAEFPIYTQYSTFLQFYPIDTGSAILTYLKRPTKSVWGYTLVSGHPVYNSGTSTQPQWSDVDIDNIIYMLLTDIGANMRDPELEQFALNQEKSNP